jgi:hypothetical protein
MNAIVPTRYFPPPPDQDPHESFYRSGELRGYYGDREILDSREFEFDCSFTGVPHRHELDVVMVRKP